MSSLELQSAIRAHSAWKEQFEFLITGVPRMPLNAQMAGDHQQCQLGRWLGSGGLKYAEDPLFDRLKETHSTFHEIAERVAVHIDKQELASANSLLEGDFAEASQRIVELLQQMRHLVKADSPVPVKDLPNSTQFSQSVSGTYNQHRHRAPD